MHILIIDAFPDSFVEAAHALPARLTYLPAADRAAVLAHLSDTDILVINSKIQVDREVIDRAPRLRAVLRAGVGMDHFDLGYMAARGVAAFNAQGGNADAVGEHALGMLLALRHNLLRADREVRQFQWRREANRGREIGGKTVGIIGYGHTGRSVARKLSGFGCRVLAYDKYLHDYSDAFAQAAGMEAIFDQAEILTLHVPLTDETRYLVDAAFLARFRQPVWLLNLARGPMVYLPALLAALDSGQVVAAGLDVLENEKLDSLSPAQRAWYEDLFARPNVILSPHVGGWTFESLDNINAMILDELRRLTSGS
ncbi:MAG: 2-hydroxyacid dehydrogenase [Bacteroidia bacterium]